MSRLFAASAIAILGALSFSALSRGSDDYEFYARKLPGSRPAPELTLSDQNGKPFTLTSLRGKLVLLSFGFTHCPNICPTTLANLANIYRRLSPDERKQLQVLFITIDPQRDNPTALKEYVQFFDPHFIGLTGREDQVTATQAAFGIDSQRSSSQGSKPPDTYEMEHTAGVFILEPSLLAGIGHYRESQLSNTQRVADDLRHLLALPAEKRNGWRAEQPGQAKPSRPSGREIYLQQCASCHLEDGRGVPGKYPSLIHSEWVLGAPNRLVALTLDGVKGAHDKSGCNSPGVMPAYRTVLPAAYIADVLTFIRQNWGNDASPISAEYVQKLFYGLPGRSDFWSWHELEALPTEQPSDAANFH